MTLFPGQPDLIWDYVGWWTLRDIHGCSVFKDLVIKRKQMDNFGAFCEQGSCKQIQHWCIEEMTSKLTSRGFTANVRRGVKVLLHA